jgi:hypothetical protein
MAGGRLMLLAIAVWLSMLVATGGTTVSAQATKRAKPAGHDAAMFSPSRECMACHNSLVAPSGEDVSIGIAWRASMMANSSRDPYWHASVRRETLDHPTRAADIEDECAICHMPMVRAQAHAEGRKAQVFAHLPIGRGEGDESQLAADGVSCTLCHQITNQRFGTRESFVGGFVLADPIAGPDKVRPTEGSARRMFGPFEPDRGRTAIMKSVTGHQQTEGEHVRQSELCATCHTLITEALGANGEMIGSIPEQVPYQEWRHSAYREERSCQSCHMPEVAGETRIASVAGEPRSGLHKHTFIGGNFFMLRMLNLYRQDLGVGALAQELDTAATRTLQQLGSQSAEVAIDRSSLGGGRLQFDVAVTNVTGHKLPTGYPSRRAWLHVLVRDRQGRAVFESGAIEPNGRIRGNDNDDDPARVEAHYTEIRDADAVQIYESVMANAQGMPTTGLLQATTFMKDNRLLPRGFDKTSAEPDIAVHGGAQQDADFTGGGDRVRYSVATGAAGPFEIEVELRYQPISFRWAQNLRAYDAPEPRRFVGYYESMASGSSTVLARAHITTGASAADDSR